MKYEEVLLSADLWIGFTEQQVRKVLQRVAQTVVGISMRTFNTLTDGVPYSALNAMVKHNLVAKRVQPPMCPDEFTTPDLAAYPVLIAPSKAHWWAIKEMLQV